MRVELSLLGHSFQDNPSWPGYQGIAANARAIEALGFDGVLVPEAGHDPFLPLLIAAGATERLRLRTGVAIAFPRSPGAMAQTAWDLARFSNGRFELGLGTQVKAHNERRYGAPWTAPPVPRLREYLACLRAIFATFQNPAQPTWFRGEHYRFDLMSPYFNPGPNAEPHVPIYVAVVNEAMARLAGELADGFYPHPMCSASYVREVMRPQVAEGARKAGRDPASLLVLGSPMIVSGATPAELAKNATLVKQRLGFYASTPSYRPVFEHHGLGDLASELFRLSKQGQWREMVALVSDDVLGLFATVATYDELGRALAERWGGVLTTVHLDLVAELDRHASMLRELAATLKAV
ncbi:MAG: TIGR03617 family F420-dependent LLM class oxidoreductase [bacterium]